MGNFQRWANYPEWQNEFPAFHFNAKRSGEFKQTNISLILCGTWRQYGGTHAGSLRMYSGDGRRKERKGWDKVENGNNVSKSRRRQHKKAGVRADRAVFSLIGGARPMPRETMINRGAFERGELIAARFTAAGTPKESRYCFVVPTKGGKMPIRTHTSPLRGTQHTNRTPLPSDGDDYV